MKAINIFIILILSAAVCGCKKFIEVGPPASQVTGAAVYNNNSSAAAVMSGVYFNMTIGDGVLTQGYHSIGFLQGLASDELTNYSNDQTLGQFYSNMLTSSSNGSSNIYYWAELYNEIHVINSAIAGLQDAPASLSMKGQLIGEAKFMRAFLYFYAVNLFGDVPLVTSPDYLQNDTLSRAPTDKVWAQVIQDLKDAKENLPDSYLDEKGAVTTEKIRPNKAAAEAMLARAYLYTNHFDSAAAEASMVINGNYQLDADLNTVFEKNSSEAIWQLLPNINAGDNTWDGYHYILSATPGSDPYYVSLSDPLLNSFEDNDKRFTDWIGIYNDGTTDYYFPYKYKVGSVYNPSVPTTEYCMILRLAEQYLIRAEAEAHGTAGGITAAITDLNTIRERAGLADYAGPVSEGAVVSAILHERQVELFTEWGHRWFDLKRNNLLNTVMPGVDAKKGSSWDAHAALMPIPLSELQADPNLTQNPGY